MIDASTSPAVASRENSAFSARTGTGNADDTRRTPRAALLAGSSDNGRSLASVRASSNRRSTRPEPSSSSTSHRSMCRAELTARMAPTSTARMAVVPSASVSGISVRLKSVTNAGARPRRAAFNRTRRHGVVASRAVSMDGILEYRPIGHSYSGRAARPPPLSPSGGPFTVWIHCRPSRRIRRPTPAVANRRFGVSKYVDTSLRRRARPALSSVSAGWRSTFATALRGSRNFISSSAVPVKLSIASLGRLRGLGARRPTKIGFTHKRDVVEERPQLRQQQRLRSVDQRVRGIRMEIDEHHVRARDHALRNDMKNVEQAVRRVRARTDRVRRVDAHRHPRQTFDGGHVCEIDKIAMRLTHVRLHAAQAEDHLAVTLRRQIFSGVKRFVERDAEATLDQHGKFLLASDQLEQLEILRVARADLQHDAGWIAGLGERVADFIDVRLVRHLHRDDLDAVFAGQLENIRQALRAETLERIRRCPRLVCAHPRADLSVERERLHHRLHRFRGIDSAQPGAHMQAVLSEMHAVVIER